MNLEFHIARGQSEGDEQTENISNLWDIKKLPEGIAKYLKEIETPDLQ